MLYRLDVCGRNDIMPIKGPRKCKAHGKRLLLLGPSVWPWIKSCHLQDPPSSRSSSSSYRSLPSICECLQGLALGRFPYDQHSNTLTFLLYAQLTE
jgi:hypothetical protein